MIQNKVGELDTEGLYNFSFDQYERYRRDNPEIAKVIDEFSKDKRDQGELASVIFPVFYALRSVTDEKGLPIPPISPKTAQEAKDEFSETEDNFLEQPIFQEFSTAIRNFTFFLDILVKDRGKSRKAKKLFAIILRMIQIERNNQCDK